MLAPDPTNRLQNQQSGRGLHAKAAGRTNRKTGANFGRRFAASRVAFPRRIRRAESERRPKLLEEHRNSRLRSDMIHKLRPHREQDMVVRIPITAADKSCCP
jgi:hypothetical protein